MRLAHLTLIVLLLVPLAARAEDAALVVANDRYELADRLRGARAVAGGAEALSGAGIDTQILRDADRSAIGNALRQLEQQSRSAEGLLVALAGRFVFSDHETWFLPTGAEGASLVDTALNAIPLSSVLDLLSATPTRAVLLLSTELDERDRVGPHLRHGIGALDIPQGVTVIRAEPSQAADILSDTLAVAGASIGDRVSGEKGAWVQGFVTDDLAFLTRATASPEGSVAPSGPDDAERRLWDRMRGRDSEDAYTVYLDAYPDGAFADEARDRLEDIRDEPFRDERQAEAALELDREARAEIQRDLVLLGHDTRGIDGVFGQGTRGAIRDWQRANDRTQTGYLTRAMIQDIDEQARRRAALLEEERRQREAERARAETAFWTETGQGRSIDGLERFLDRFPDGTYADQARRRLAELRAERGDGDAGAVREQLAWDRARAADTIASYTEFARAYPRGRFADRARDRIAALRAEGGAAEEASAQAAEEKLGLNQLTRRAVEQRLAAEGFDVGQVDGRFDTRARNAIRAYQQDAQLPATGYLNQITVVRLLADSVRRVLQ